MSSYPAFSDLPLELREEIWEFAIPNRISEVGIPAWAQANMFGCEMTNTSRQNAKLPTIASVCHEAYQVVRKHGHRLKECYPLQAWTLPSYRYNGRNIDIPLWNPTFDTLHLNWELNEEGDYLQTQLDELRHLLARMPTECKISLLAHPFHIPGIDHCATSEELLCLAPGRDYQAVWHVVCVHADRSDVVESGLFDKGDSPIVLVDVSDTNKISEYAGLLRHYLPGIECESNDFLEDLLGSEILPSAIKTWRSELTKLWVWSRWCEARFHLYVDTWGLDIISYYDRGEHGKKSWPFTSKAPRGIKRFVDRQEMLQHNLNLDDPWVAAEVESVPKLSPVIMFRLCEKDCPMTQDLTNRCIRKRHRLLNPLERGAGLRRDRCECGHARPSLGRNYEPGAAERLVPGGEHSSDDLQFQWNHEEMLRMRDMLKYGYITKENRTRR